MQRFFLAVLMSTAGAWAAQRLDPSNPIVLENTHARFEFEPGGMGIAGMIDRAASVNHVQPVAGRHLLWEAVFAKGRQQTKLTNNSRPCNYATSEDLPDGTKRLVLEWNNLRLWLEDKAVDVRVLVELPAASGIARWRIFLENRSNYWGLWNVSYPLVNGFPAGGEYDIARPVFASGGHLLRKWTSTVTGRYPSGSWPMQFMSLAKGANAVYFGTMDPEARVKDFVVQPGTSLALVHFPENMGVAGSDLPE